MTNANPQKIESARTQEKRIDWATPVDFFNKFDSIFNFNIDVCAGEHNKKVDLFFSEEEDSLQQDWRVDSDTKGICWMNPPYGRGVINKWVEYGVNQIRIGNCSTLVSLLPASFGAKWFERSVILPGKSGGMDVLILPINHRIKFEGAKDGAFFDSVIVVYQSIEVYAPEIQNEKVRALGIGTPLKVWNS